MWRKCAIGRVLLPEKVLLRHESGTAGFEDASAVAPVLPFERAVDHRGGTKPFVYMPPHEG
jgi:hypothetical protein